MGEDSAEGRFTGPYNLTGHPASRCPCPSPACRSASSWPAGVADLALLRVAAAVERVLDRPALPGQGAHRVPGRQDDRLGVEGTLQVGR